MQNIIKIYTKFENILASLIFFLVALMPIYEFLVRNISFFLQDTFGLQISIASLVVKDSEQLLYHLLFVLTAFALAISEREGEHLNIGIVGVIFKNNPESKLYKTIQNISGVIGLVLLIALFFGGFSMIFMAFSPDETVSYFPKIIFLIFLPLNYFVTCIRFTKRIPSGKFKIPLLILSLILAKIMAIGSIQTLFDSFSLPYPDFIPQMVQFNTDFFAKTKWFFIVLFIVAGILSMPLFLIMGGLAMMLFISTGQSIDLVLFEGYGLVTQFTIPSIALFTLTGFILTSSKAGLRLITFFSNLLSFFPSGIIIVVVIVSAFFTIFTGASGVTILALGSLLLTMLKNYDEEHALGLVTSSGSIGLLFPPSLAIILYGSTAQVSILDLFLAGIVPGIVMIAVVSTLSIIILKKKPGVELKASKFNPKETSASFVDGIFEIFMPGVLFISYIEGITNLTETASLSVLYVFVVEILIKKDVKVKDLISIFVRCISILGGILAILSVAKGLSAYIIDIQFPQSLAEWIKAHVSSKIVFLLVLNVALLVVGTMMDIFSAILVVAPLVIPLGEVFGIHPVHFAMIFLINLEMGFMTPPVGMNLFLASYSFHKELTVIYRSIIPFFIIQLIGLMLITYVPSISTIGIDLFGALVNPVNR